MERKLAGSAYDMNVLLERVFDQRMTDLIITLGKENDTNEIIRLCGRIAELENMRKKLEELEQDGRKNTEAV